VSTSKPDNAERNARILDLARQGKTQAEIARELGLSRGTVSGVIQRGREAETLAKPRSPQASEERRPDEVGGEKGAEAEGGVTRG
jgi:transposase